MGDKLVYRLFLCIVHTQLEPKILHQSTLPVNNIGLFMYNDIVTETV